MLPRANGTAYEFLFAALPEPVEYYVEAAGVKSKTFKLDVVDLPGIKKIKVTYHYPVVAGTDTDPTEDPGGDLRAVAGTIAELDRRDRSAAEERRDRDGRRLARLRSKRIGSNMLTAKVPIQKDGIVSLCRDGAGPERAPERGLFHRSARGLGASVKITQPGADAKVSPIEEVTIEVEGGRRFRT